jgi:hypothetical protein
MRVLFTIAKKNWPGFRGETEPDRLFEGDEEFTWKLEGRGTGRFQM